MAHSSPAKVLLTNFHPGDGGGQTTYLLQLAASANEALDIRIACPATSKCFQLATERGLPVYAQDFPAKIKELGAFLSNRRKFQNLLANEGFDIVHCNGSPDLKVTLAALAGLKQKPAVVYTQHNSLNIGLGPALRLRFGTRHVIAVSEHTGAMLRNAWPSIRNTTVIHNGIDTGFYDPELDLPSAAAQFPLPADRLVFVSVAGTAYHKGWHLLVKAAAGLPEDLRRKSFFIVCGKPPSQAFIHEHVVQLGMEQQVFFPGMQGDVRPIIALGDVGFVISTAIETISFACREMMAMGKPVIVSDFAGLPENITHGGDGWITRTNDVDAIREALLDIWLRRSDLPSLGAAARQKALTQFQGIKALTATHGVYRQIHGELTER